MIVDRSIVILPFVIFDFFTAVRSPDPRATSGLAALIALNVVIVCEYMHV